MGRRGLTQTSLFATLQVREQTGESHDVCANNPSGNFWAGEFLYENATEPQHWECYLNHSSPVSVRNHRINITMGDEPNGQRTMHFVLMQRRKLNALRWTIGVPRDHAIDCKMQDCEGKYLRDSNNMLQIEYQCGKTDCKADPQVGPPAGDVRNFARYARE